MARRRGQAPAGAPVRPGRIILPAEQHARLAGDLREHRGGRDGSGARPIDQRAEGGDARAIAVEPMPDRRERVALAGAGQEIQAELLEIAREAGGEPIMRMGRDGKWIYGQENIEVEEGSRWAVNPLSLMHGFICWKVIPQGSKEKPELLGEEMRTMYEAKPAKDSLPDYGHPWDDCISLNLLCVGGEDDGTQALYKTSSTGGMRACKELIASIMAQLDKDPDHPVPIVELKADHYDHKTYGKTYFPVIEIVEWAAMDERPEAEGDEPEAEAEQPAKAAEPAPATRHRGAAPAPARTAPAPEPETVAAAPEQRRRRRG